MKHPSMLASKGSTSKGGGVPVREAGTGEHHGTGGRGVWQPTEGSIDKRGVSTRQCQPTRGAPRGWEWGSVAANK